MFIRGALIAGSLLAAAYVSAQEAPAPTVNFGVGRESFDETGIDTLSRAVRDIRRSGYGSVQVDGHTDTLGDEVFNLGLSQRRATVIRRELMARGVQAETVRIGAFGQTDLAVATADNVAEAQNRRVTIALDAPGAFPPPNPLAPFSFRLP